ncbi:MAG: DegT/DnrJ/EryC1/StrS family aminotransferase [Planctomycetes bacterium]|nr:DegT/DnrJ/EryC1/StrS family aminotransferase [Planctomycetota bacterium]MCP4770094.1 DegT/DnrJ/EryC1/StrS family aminotransferase [Planctomycetota bacterium]MCP4860758.1 DegT/DnrJ/EryC1/StrS family aminotransferase [Planctomycetota bacterium]
MAVPFFDIQYNLDLATKKSLLGRWENILNHGGFVNGPEVRELEAALAEFLDIPHVVCCSNGSDALVLALRAAGVGPGDEVLVPAFTFFASAGAVSRCGAKPVFVDIDPDTYLISAEDAASKVTAATKAVMVVHLYGMPADIPALEKVINAAAGREIAVVEDAAQAVGATHPDGVVGGMGTSAGWSCFPTKNLGSPGDAGFATAANEEVAERMRRLREHGGGRQYYHDEVGYNFRMDSLQAAGLLEFLPRLVEFNGVRRNSAEHYSELFTAAGLAGKHLTLPINTPGHVYHQYVIRTDKRDDLMAFLRARDIGCAVYYPLSLHLQPCYQDLGGQLGDLPESERATEQVLALPIYPGVTFDHREELVSAVAEFFGV